MNTHKYICKYCYEEYIPKRRYSQKYCSNSCRSKAYHRRQVEKGSFNNSKTKENSPSVINDPTEYKKSPNEITHTNSLPSKGMSTAGVGNAVLGTLIADFLKYVVKDEGDQPASKNDIAALFNKLERYHHITNLPPKPFGKLPYFDLQTNEVVYF